MSGQENALQKKLQRDTKLAQKLVKQLDKLEPREKHENLEDMEQQIASGNCVGEQLKRELIAVLKDINRTVNTVSDIREPKILSDEEMLLQNEETEEKTGWTTILQRMHKRNPDIALLIIVLILVGFTMYTFTFIKISLTVTNMDDLNANWKTYLELVVGMILSVIAIQWKLSTPQGDIAQKMMRKANKQEIDQWGRTLRS